MESSLPTSCPAWVSGGRGALAADARRKGTPAGRESLAFPQESLTSACGFQRVPVSILIMLYLTREGWIGLGVGACPSRAREGKENQVGVCGGVCRDIIPPLLPRRPHSFSLRLALGVMGREASMALQHEGVIMEGMWHVAGLWHRTAWRG